MNTIIVAIDGYSSCGKSTMAKRLAREVNYIYVDTGAMYRAMGLYAVRKGFLTPETLDQKAIVSALEHVEIQFRTMPEGVQHTILNGEDVESEIRTLEISQAASRVSTIAEVRTYMVSLQQAMGQKKGIVMDGRDIGTVVFPYAELKVFVTADVAIRARRRFDELVSKGESALYDQVLSNVKDRDYRDAHREVSPLLKAKDARVLDNSNLDKEQQYALLLNWFNATIQGLL